MSSKTKNILSGSQEKAKARANKGKEVDCTSILT